jgi:hypothetical protein
MGKKKVAVAAALPSRKLLDQLGGWCGGSIGQMEALAGIDVQNPSERKALWDQFRQMYVGPTQALFDAVMDHCAQITLARIGRGELCILKTRGVA